MKRIKSFVGRRQFLMAAGAASACALTSRKLAGFHAHSAVAAEAAAAAGKKVVGNRCASLMSPLRIRNVMLKNRIMHTVSPTYFMQGPENYPTENFRNHYSNVAKNAAIVTISTQFGETWPVEWGPYWDAISHMSNRAWEDIPPVWNYIDQMIEDIHNEGALVLCSGNTGGMGPSSSGEGPGSGGGGQGGPGGAPGAASGGRGGGMPGMSSQTDDEILEEAKEAETKGYDIYQMNGSSAGAAAKIRAQTNLILMARFNGSRGNMGMGSGANALGLSNDLDPTADELEEAVEAARKLEGMVDVLWIRVDEHPNAWTQDKGKPRSLFFAEAIKKAGIDIITCPSAGFHDPVANDGYIAGGKTDMVGMTTPFFADPELVMKVKEGRADDVVPCIACQNCHGISVSHGPWYSTCSVNPTWGVPAYRLQGIRKPTVSKKVAVIGGGPAGMKAAMVAAERGHKVTLYEKESALGGLLKISDNSRWRWNFKDLKEYFITQVEKAGVDVKLNTAATKAMLKKQGFDTVLVAVGTDVVTSRLKAGNSKVFTILDAYYKKSELGKHVVILGAGKYGMEAATGMLKDGHRVTVLTSASLLIEAENNGAHNMANQKNIYSNHPDFSYALEADIKNVSGGKVTYTDSTGASRSVQADTIVIWSGLKPRMDEAEKFAGAADDVLLLGDCTGRGGSLQKTLRNAFFIASQV
jgi:2,4-dienoyl-CoA reductase-like NADH-dependent reductase (Old Yellow Enzyme family)/thioredoxin reductase